LMSCNPAIGGVGKGQLVKEIDALGGVMGKAADACGIQFRILNASKGAAVHSSRAQIDMYKYNQYMVKLVKKQDRLSLKEAQVRKLIVVKGKVAGVVIDKGSKIYAKCVILCPGTFLDGVIHKADKHSSGGRINEEAAIGLGDDLRRLGFNLLRFKTGTPARLDKNTIDFSFLIRQKGDNPPRPFSFTAKKIRMKQIPCYITYTNKKTHKIIKDNLKYSSMYSGAIKAVGVRYCPSIEDKIVKFADRERHQIFLEPQGLSSDEVYPNGLSTSLPDKAQLEMIHSIEGLKKARVIRFGYAIEHLVVEPTQVYPTLETKLVKNLYLAGQINGTTGYEEAAAQGLIAGINAARSIKNKKPFILDRATSYIGVLIDDLTTKGTDEPYRMFTSRVEYRLILREDNADLRLRKIGYDLGLVSKKDYIQTQKKQDSIKKGMVLLNSMRIKPTDKINKRLKGWRQPFLKEALTLKEILRRPRMDFEKLRKLNGIKLNIKDDIFRQIEIDVKYEGFIKRQLSEVESFRSLEKIKIPKGLDYVSIPSLSKEIKEKLAYFRPLTLGQASRISGVTPAAISLLMVYMKLKKPSII
ncbi:MAG TPA: tRNA uridine-5-carboxymethylaminomethyl(34) synthesis enzyme MnmG, partial [Candidatus Omnitrophica bacterium]|nr:tRNA uridine-5-carboxymethylaminomethyl(34) synthesis enzyme MnmG [Candidatus Omnitrophota bacterium]